jgi:tetratricopeptide (TPR) repeat protein
MKKPILVFLALVLPAAILFAADKKADLSDTKKDAQVNALFKTATKCMNSHDVDGAIAALTKILKLDPKNGNAAYYRAITKLSLKNDLAGADKDFDLAISLDPDDKYSYANKGAIGIMKKDYKGAIKYYSKAISIDPAYFLAYTNRATAYCGAGDYAKSIMDSEKAIKLHPDNPVAYDSMAIAKFKLKDYKGCIAATDACIKLDPKFSEAYYYRAMAEENTGKKDPAKEDYSKAKKLGYEPDKLAIKMHNSDNDK